MQKTRVTNTQVTEISNKQKVERPDLLATEEPMEIRLVYGNTTDRIEKKLAVTMRTPGHDFELAIGFLFTEGILKSFSDIKTVEYCQQVKSKEEEGNVVRVVLNAGVEVELSNIERNFYTTSSCGVCGKSSIDALKFQCNAISDDFSLASETLLRAPDVMRKEQAVFEHTGGLHAAALFDGSGQLIFLREDIGRHNALDKLIGTALADGLLPLNKYFIMVSGRIGFELVQKSIMAGVPLLGAVGAPSSLAVEVAYEYGITLAGFVRNGSFNVYAGEERIQ